MPKRRWNQADSELVMQSHALTAEELTKLLPKRRASEIRRLREALHTYHTSKWHRVPSETMAPVLGRNTGKLVCAKCGETY